MPELASLALSVRFKKSFTEIDEGWSQRDVNLAFFFLRAQALAAEPNHLEFYRQISLLSDE